MNRVVSVLTWVFWASVALLVALLGLSWLGRDFLAGLLGDSYFVRLGGVLVGLVMVSSAFLTWHEFRANPVEESERGEWTMKALLYAIVFAITFFLSFQFLPALFFSF